MRSTAEEHLVSLRHQVELGTLTSEVADAAAHDAAKAVAGEEEGETGGGEGAEGEGEGSRENGAAISAAAAAGGGGLEAAAGEEIEAAAGRGEQPFPGMGVVDVTEGGGGGGGKAGRLTARDLWRRIGGVAADAAAGEVQTLSASGGAAGGGQVRTQGEEGRREELSTRGNCVAKLQRVYVCMPCRGKARPGGKLM